MCQMLKYPTIYIGRMAQSMDYLMGLSIVDAKNPFQRSKMIYTGERGTTRSRGLLKFSLL